MPLGSDDKFTSNEIETAQLSWRNHPQKKAAGMIFSRIGFHKGTFARRRAIALVLELFQDLSRCEVERWLKDPEYLEYLQAEADKFCFRCTQKLDQLIDALDLGAIIYSLKCNNPEQWDDKYIRDRANWRDKIELESMRIDKLKEMATRPLPVIVYTEDEYDNAYTAAPEPAKKT